MQLITYEMLMLQPPPAKYGGRHTVTLIPGDGIGPELLNHVKEVFRLVRLKLKHVQIVDHRPVRIASPCGLYSCCRFSCVPVDFEVVHVNSALESEDDINNAITAIRRNGVALKGKQTPFVSVSQSEHENRAQLWEACHFVIRPWPSVTLTVTFCNYSDR